MYWIGCFIFVFRHHLDFHPWVVCRSFAWGPHLEFQFLLQVGCHKECMFSWTWHQEWVFGSRSACKVCNSVFTVFVTLHRTFTSNTICLPAVLEITVVVSNIMLLFSYWCKHLVQNHWLWYYSWLWPFAEKCETAL